MECPSCGSELEYHDTFGKYLGSAYEQKMGTIYKCPTACSEDEEVAETCESSVFHVIGCWYDYNDGHLHSGYPC